MEINVRGLNKATAKGRTYYYHRASGRRLTGEPGSPEFMAAYAAAEASVTKRVSTPGTLGLLIDAYRKSDYWGRLAPKTRLSYDRAMDLLSSIRDMPLTKIDPGFVAGLRDKVMAKRGRWMANYVITLLSILSDFALERRWMTENPTKPVRRIRKDKQARVVNRPWTPAECRAVLDAAPPYLALPIALAMCTGLRKGDVLTVVRDVVHGGMILVRTKKTGAAVNIPLHPALANALAQAPAHSAKTLCSNSRGQSWTESGFNSTFIKFIAGLEKLEKVSPGLTMHGLRHTLGTRLIEAGASDRAAADLLGHADTKMTRHYSKLADTGERDKTLINAVDLFGEKAARKARAKG